jgi:hypothetical protein
MTLLDDTNKYAHPLTPSFQYLVSPTRSLGLGANFLAFWAGLILAIAGCICDPQVVPSAPDPAATIQASNQPDIIVVKDIVASDLSTITLTVCDFCLKPIAATDKETLAKEMRGCGWYVTIDNKVICAECAAKKTKLRTGNYF